MTDTHINQHWQKLAELATICAQKVSSADLLDYKTRFNGDYRSSEPECTQKTPVKVSVNNHVVKFTNVSRAGQDALDYVLAAEGLLDLTKKDPATLEANAQVRMRQEDIRECESSIRFAVNEATDYVVDLKRTEAKLQAAVDRMTSLAEKEPQAALAEIDTYRNEEIRSGRKVMAEQMVGQTAAKITKLIPDSQKNASQDRADLVARIAVAAGISKEQLSVAMEAVPTQVRAA